MSSNVTGERSFSILKRIKDRFCSQILDDALSNLTKFRANLEIIQKMDFGEIVLHLAAQK